MKNMYVSRIVIKAELFYDIRLYNNNIIFSTGGTSEAEMGGFTSYYKKFL